MLEELYCYKCKIIKPLNQFYNRRNRSEKYGDWCIECRKEYNKQNKEQIDSWHKSRRENDRKRVIKEYGSKCTCCGETESIFLTIDHIDETGAQHRNEFSNHICDWLIQNKFPKKNFQLLCMNCNWAKHISGMCPHQLTN